MRRWIQRTHLAGFVALTITACARGEHVPVGGGIAVTDDAGRRVTLAAPARRIVSLVPSFTEILFAIGAGDRLVGRTTWCDSPPEALALPSVGDGMPPSVEAVAARRPDLVVLYRAGPNVTAAEQLERLGIRTVLLDLNLLEQLGPAARRLGVLTGHSRAADSLAHVLDSLASQPPAPSTRSLAFIVWDNPPIVIGAGSYLDRLAALAGARNVFHDVGAPSAQVSIETIAARDPDFVALLSDSAVPPRYAMRPEWRVLLAAAILTTLAAALLLGPANVPFGDLLASPIVWQLRLPRAVLAFLVGGALGVSGVGLQALVRNPLADPFLLGLSGGAGLGAVVAIAFHLPGPWALPLAAFVGAVGAMALVYRLGLMSGAELDPRILLLGGVAVGAFAAAITTALVSLAEATELRNAFLWLWGGFSGASWTTVLVILVYAPLPLVVL